LACAFGHVRTAGRTVNRLGYDIVSFKKTNLATFFSSVAARGFKPTHVLDVGANKGNWSRTVRAVFPEATFTLIEPQIEMATDLERFCAETPGARWIAAGAGAVPGELKFFVCPDTVSSTFQMTEEKAKQYGYTQSTVPVVTVDDVCRDICAVPELIKLDVEGFEDKVLNGSQTLLGKTELILLELVFFGLRSGSKTAAEMIQIMADFGYVLYDFTSFQFRPYDGALGLCEAPFAKANGLLRSHAGWA
jgi:FkbM family methyltransferase